MNQLSFEFFFPLTEQIPLDLDYTGCMKPSYSTNVGSVTGSSLSYIGGTMSTTLTASNLTLDVETTTVKLKEEPGLCRRTLLKCLDLKWEKK